MPCDSSSEWSDITDGTYASTEIDKERMLEPTNCAWVSIARLLGLDTEKFYSISCVKELRFPDEPSPAPEGHSPGGLSASRSARLFEALRQANAILSVSIRTFASLSDMELNIASAEPPLIAKKFMITYPCSFDAKGRERERHACVYERQEGKWHYHDFQNDDASAGFQQVYPIDLDYIGRAKKALEVARSKREIDHRTAIDCTFFNASSDEVKSAALRLVPAGL